ncbi:hypothetical protein ABZ807_17090 [Micromonospora sp. NPDC047548]|uniref:hypothetical protein n=1 Tax=Micromonospora sp. NPDC047548 TaxID=3155624 RepID=UPI0033FA57F3
MTAGPVIAASPATRLARLVADAAARVELDLTDRVVLTEAATGAYVVTPVLAALAGAARVHAWTRASRHGSVAEVHAQTEALAAQFGVADRITITDHRSLADVAAADVVTNSGHVRPIDATLVAAMKPGAVVPLMFEAWEIQAGRFDLDLERLRQRGVAVAGTNERHPSVDVFSYLGLMAVKALIDAGIPTYGTHLGVLCDNPFEDYLVRGLRGAGARSVTAAASVAGLSPAAALDALVVSLRPTGGSVLSPATVEEIATRWPGLPVVQYWGDLDRAALDAAGLPYWPMIPPSPGHMAVLPSAVGPDPIVRLQAGGLKVAEVLLRPPALRRPQDLEFLDEL